MAKSLVSFLTHGVFSKVSASQISKITFVVTQSVTNARVHWSIGLAAVEMPGDRAGLGNTGIRQVRVGVVAN